MKLTFKTLVVACWVLVSVQTHAQLFGSREPNRIELTEKSDMATAYGEAFQQPGALAQKFRRPDFKHRKLAIGAFEVEYSFEQVGRSVEKGTSGTGNKELTYFLQNVTEAQMQQVTEKAYTQFVELAKAQGYEILGADAVANAASFKEQLAKTNPGPVKKDKSGGIASMVTGKSDGDSDNVTVLTSAKGTANYPGLVIMSTGPLGALAKETGAVVVGVRLKVNFMTITDKGGIAFAGVEAKPQNVVALTSKIEFYAPEDMTMWSLPIWRQVILPSSIAEKAVGRVAKTDEKAKAAGKAVLSGVMGFLKGGLSGAAGGMKGQDIAEALGESPNYDVTAGADYVDKVAGDLKLVMQLFSQSLPKDATK